MHEYLGLPPDYDSDYRNVDLPTYSHIFGRVIPTTNLNPSGPTDGAAKVFKYDLGLKGKENSSASLMIYGDAVLSKHLPTFAEGSNLNGTVKANLGNGQSINTVVVSIRGRILSGASSYTFLDCSETLWANSPSDALQSNGPPKSIGTAAKLSGEHEWTFSIKLPKEMALSLGTGSKDSPRRVEVFPLPHSCLERHARASVQYEVIARFTRGLFKTDYRIIAPFGYIPIIRPEPPSFLRQIAYEENTAIPSPSEDPEGWLTLEPVRFQGKLFNRQLVEATCTLSLAAPLSYARGSVIPLHLEIQSHNVQALDILSASHSIVCRLRREIRYDPDEHKVVDPKLLQGQIEHSELATWWLSSEAGTFNRGLDGEIFLPPDLKPTTAIGRFHLQYSVVLFPSDSNSFQAAGNEPLLIHPVQIATAFSLGPSPRTYAPESSFMFTSSSPIETNGFF